MEIGIGALLGGSGGSRLACSNCAGLSLSLLSFEGDRLELPSRLCRFPNGAFGVEADC